MAQDCIIYAKVSPPTTLERKRFGYKQHDNRSTAGGRAKMLRPSVRYAMPFFRAVTPLAGLRPLQSTRGRGNYAIWWAGELGFRCSERSEGATRGSEADNIAQFPRLKRLRLRCKSVNVFCACRQGVARQRFPRMLFPASS